MMFQRSIFRAMLLLVTAGAATSCTSHGVNDNPLIRPFEWFSYANGDDIRATCKPGFTNRYRFIYNAIYDQQVRTYNITQIPTAKEATQTTRVFAGSLSKSWILNGSEGFTSGENESRVNISLKDLLDIEQALVKSGFEQPAVEGQILHSDSFYWIAMVCRDGNFKYYAWNDENSDIPKLPFRKVLSVGD
ncbi:MAG: hypothetical protein EP348_06520, partial [Alphaproteobacteria bacterium]